mmetsp:Transcript_90827/g.293897  ORF Transcript_90827/g.293897 Transcript_90827/m.293897 type:complete len:387 (+) Transcript_90827:67-1227(+)
MAWPVLRSPGRWPFLVLGLFCVTLAVEFETESAFALRRADFSGDHALPVIQASTLALFEEYDLDSSGTLQPEELAAFLKSRTNVTPAQVNKVMRKSDKDIDWAVNFQEFLGCVVNPTCNDLLYVSDAHRLGVNRSLAKPDDEPYQHPARVSERVDREPLYAHAECTDADREALKPVGLVTEGQEAASGTTMPAMDPVHAQTVQIRNVWTQTLIMSPLCKEALVRVGLYNRMGHATCLSQSLSISLPCAKCNADYLYNMVHNCSAPCETSLNSRGCIECTQPLKLLECVYGAAKFAELGLAAAKVRGASRTGALVKVRDAENSLAGTKDLESVALEDASAQDDAVISAEVAESEDARGQDGMATEPPMPEPAASALDNAVALEDVPE